MKILTILIALILASCGTEHTSSHTCNGGPCYEEPIPEPKDNPKDLPEIEYQPEPKYDTPETILEHEQEEEPEPEFDMAVYDERVEWQSYHKKVNKLLSSIVEGDNTADFPPSVAEAFWDNAVFQQSFVAYNGDLIKVWDIGWTHELFWGENNYHQSQWLYAYTFQIKENGEIESIFNSSEGITDLEIAQVMSDNNENWLETCEKNPDYFKCLPPKHLSVGK